MRAAPRCFLRQRARERAASATVRVKVPSVSSVPLKTCAPVKSIATVGRLEADDAAERAGRIDRAVGLRADRAGELARRDGRRGSRRRSARRVGRLPRVACHARIEERERPW
jgi:hypothetical protein